MIEEALEVVNRKLFSAVSTDVSNRIYYGKAPEGTEFPLIHYFDVASRDGYQIKYDKVTVQVSCWAASALDAIKIMRDVRAAFREFSGVVTTYLGDVRVNWTEIIDASSLTQTDPELNGQQIRIELRMAGDNIS